MPFFKLASVPVLAVYQSSGKFTKRASNNENVDDASDNVVKKSINLISKDVLNAVSKVYNLSSKIDDYIFPIPRAVTADVPNSNGDLFSHNELTRFSSKHKCLVYETFRNDPLHVEHVASDPKAARGFLPDAHYVQANPQDKFVITITAVDTTKDSALAKGLLSGEINSFSMGCICDNVRCSYCGHVASSDADLCDCLRRYKMAKIGGKLVYEECLGVEYQELSVVGNPADPKALTQAILQYTARENERKEVTASFNVLSSLATKSDQVEIAKYFRQNLGKLPESVVRLANKLF